MLPSSYGGVYIKLCWTCDTQIDTSLFLRSYEIPDTGDARPPIAVDDSDSGSTPAVRGGDHAPGAVGNQDGKYRADGDRTGGDRTGGDRDERGRIAPDEARSGPHETRNYR